MFRQKRQIGVKYPINMAQTNTFFIITGQNKEGHWRYFSSDNYYLFGDFTI
jgi:hypothetical protein